MIPPEKERNKSEGSTGTSRTACLQDRIGDRCLAIDLTFCHVSISGVLEGFQQLLIAGKITFLGTVTLIPHLQAGTFESMMEATQISTYFNPIFRNTPLQKPRKEAATHQNKTKSLENKLLLISIIFTLKIQSTRPRLRRFHALHWCSEISRICTHTLTGMKKNNGQNAW